LPNFSVVGALKRHAPLAVLGAMIALYIGVFGALTWRQQSNYGTFGFDMGLHDQGIWLTSRFMTPFVTVRGMNYYGHHVNLISALYAPAYWLGAGPHFLYLTETIALALGAVPIWLIGRHRLGEMRGAVWVAIVPAVAYLLHPSIEWINWWHWHPEAMAITPMLFAWLFAIRLQWRAMAACLLVALLCKEDVALAVAMFGVALVLARWVKAPFRLAAIITFGGLAWFAVATRVVIPAILGATPFYERTLFPAFGDSLPSVAKGMLTHPGKVASMAFESGRLTYYQKLLAPMGCVSLAAAPVLAIAGPQVLVNVLSALPGTYDIRFQYSSMVLVGVVLAAVEGLALLRKWRLAMWVAVGTMTFSAFVGNVLWSPSPLGHDYDNGVWARRIPRHDAFDRAVDLVPRDASVSATYYLIPHLTHRRAAYEWPNPWKLVNWGLSGEDAPDPRSVDYVVVDTTLNQEPGLLDTLTNPGGEYDVVFSTQGVVVARRH
jgi:uncharacterized membrane protein